MKLCKVCSVPVSMRRGYYQNICEACQKFFRRYCSQRDSLQCISGDHKCVIDESTRRYCPSCRFHKCLNAGMRSKLLVLNNRNEKSPSTTKSSSSPSSSSPTPPACSNYYDQQSAISGGDQLILMTTSVPGVVYNEMSSPMNSSPSLTSSTSLEIVPFFRNDSPPDMTLMPLVQDPVLFDGTSIEETLRSCVQAFTRLHGYHSLPLTKPAEMVLQSGNTSLIKLASHHVMLGVDIALSYCEYLAEREGLSRSELRMLIGGFPSKSVAVFRALAGSGDGSFFGIDRSFKDIILKLFPLFSEPWNLSEELETMLSHWNPSFIESSVLLALLFFNEKSISTPKLYRIRQRLLTALNLYKHQNFVPTYHRLPSGLTPPPPGTSLAVATKSSPDVSRRYLHNCLNLTQNVVACLLNSLAMMSDQEPEFAQWNAVV